MEVGFALGEGQEPFFGVGDDRSFGSFVDFFDSLEVFSKDFVDFDVVAVYLTEVPPITSQSIWINTFVQYHLQCLIQLFTRRTSLLHIPQFSKPDNNLYELIPL